ncbi:AAA family ATPase [Bacillus sp. T3]|uniref:AAA family ATPase n=1 Tax=Bacillus sp. T3 TaxID=467262 RepID=UPI0029820721|nr:AAA family ATPase [Bacillus sp. T3]
MIHWYYFSDTNKQFAELERLLENMQYSLTYIHKFEEMQQHLLKHQQTVLFLKAETKYDVYELCQEVSVLYPHIYIIIIVPENMENMKRAMQVGASDLSKASSNKEELEEIILQAENYMKHRQSKDNIYNINLIKKDGRVISVCNPKGGLGRTSFIVNAAVAFAKEGKKVAVIDANLQFGDVALYLDLKPKRTIYEWVKEAYGDPQYSIDQYLLQHKSGISVFAAPPRPEFFEFIHVEHISKAIEELKNIFDVILIDPPAYLSEIHLVCIKNSDEILIMLTNDIPVLRTTKMYIDILDSLNFRGKAKCILNRELKNKGLDRNRIEEILGISIFSSLPDQETIVKASLNEGIPYLLSQPRAPISKAVIETIKMMTNNDEAIVQQRKKEKRRLFSKR